jgi:mannosylglycoprotein endo-beta-mannosidase
MKPVLLYADDALFIVKPEEQQIQVLKIGLIVFEAISGLAVNMQKSELILTEQDEQLALRLVNILGCELGAFPITYLGLPLSNKKLKRTAYIPLIQRFNKRLAGWAAKHLSIAGRLVLLNAVLSALPVYFMSCFLLPSWVRNDIDKIRRKFLWHGVTVENKKNERSQLADSLYT